MYRISPRFQKLYRKLNQTLLHWATGFFSLNMQKEICNLSLCRQIFDHGNFVQNFLLVPEMISNIQSKPYVEKYSNIAILFRISPGSKNYITISIRPLELRDFFQKFTNYFWWTEIWKFCLNKVSIWHIQLINSNMEDIKANGLDSSKSL